MRVKEIISNSTDSESFTNAINKFIADKKVISIKFAFTEDKLKHALIIYDHNDNATNTDIRRPNVKFTDKPIRLVKDSRNKLSTSKRFESKKHIDTNSLLDNANQEESPTNFEIKLNDGKNNVDDQGQGEDLSGIRDAHIVKEDRKLYLSSDSKLDWQGSVLLQSCQRLEPIKTNMKMTTVDLYKVLEEVIAFSHAILHCKYQGKELSNDFINDFLQKHMLLKEIIGSKRIGKDCSPIAYEMYVREVLKHLKDLIQEDFCQTWIFLKVAVLNNDTQQLFDGVFIPYTVKGIKCLLRYIHQSDDETDFNGHSFYVISDSARKLLLSKLKSEKGIFD